MSSTTVMHFPNGVHLFVSQGLRPAGQTLGLSVEFEPADREQRKTNIGANGKLGENDIAYFVVLDSSFGPSRPGTARWWIHDGDDFWEPAIADEANGGQGSFEVGA